MAYTLVIVQTMLSTTTIGQGVRVQLFHSPLPMQQQCTGIIAIDSFFLAFHPSITRYVYPAIDTIYYIGHAQGIGNDHSNTLIFQ